MSAKIMGEVWDLNLPSNEQAVLLALADHADHAGSRIYPSNGLVAWKVGVSEQTVRRLKRKLEGRGILVRVNSPSGRVWEYRIDLSKGQKKAPYAPRRTENQFPEDDVPADNPPTELCNPLQNGTPYKPVPTPLQPEPNPPTNCNPLQIGRGYKSPPTPLQSSVPPPPTELCSPNRHITKEPLARALSEADIPTWEEVKAQAEIGGVLETSAKAFFDHHEDNALWLNQYSRLINWKRKLLSWAATDRQPKKSNYANNRSNSGGRPQGPPDRNAGTYNVNQDIEALKSKVW